MGIYSMMRTGVSGMNAQANRLSSVADNVANSSTVGYKRTDVQFSTLVVPYTRNAYQSGSVNSHVRHDIAVSGAARNTARPGDIMINGNGFFRVAENASSPQGQYPLLTRAGSFERDGDGYMRNAQGYYLLDDNDEPIRLDPAVKDTDYFEPQASTELSMTMNLDPNAKVPKDDSGVAIPFDPTKSASYNQKKSTTIYDAQGNKFNVDIYFVKTADNKWDVHYYDSSTPPQKLPTSTGSNPAQLTFDSKGSAVNPPAIALDMHTFAPSRFPAPPDGKPVNVDFGKAPDGKAKVTQWGENFSFGIKNDGYPSGFYDSFRFSEKGEVMINYSNGQTRQLKNDNGDPVYVGLATVTSPNSLSVLSGTVFQYNADSGSYIKGTAGTGVFGNLFEGTLEESNADIGDELTDMIEAQRNYSANSKVFQTGSEVMDVLVNLKR